MALFLPRGGGGCVWWRCWLIVFQYHVFHRGCLAVRVAGGCTCYFAKIAFPFPPLSIFEVRPKVWCLEAVAVSVAAHSSPQLLRLVWLPSSERNLKELALWAPP